MSKLYGVSMGPGDPGLVTNRALNIIKEADVLLIPTGRKEDSRAYRIAAGYIPLLDEKECLAYEFPMTRDETVQGVRRRSIYEDAKRIVQAGRSVACLVIGDASLYATFGYLLEMAKADGIDCEVVSGVNSFSEAAAALTLPVALDDEEVHIIPGSADLSASLSYPGTKIYMKLGRKLKELLDLLRKDASSGRISVSAVENAGMPDERIYPTYDDIPESAGYLTTVIVK